MARPQNQQWTTKNEIEFLRGLGSHGPGSYVPGRRSTVTCLEGYIKSAEHRDEWGAINKEKVVRVAEAMLYSMK